MLLFSAGVLGDYGCYSKNMIYALLQHRTNSFQGCVVNDNRVDDACRTLHVWDLFSENFNTLIVDLFKILHL